jgi:hypothetical protein
LLNLAEFSVFPFPFIFVCLPLKYVPFGFSFFSTQNSQKHYDSGKKKKNPSTRHPFYFGPNRDGRIPKFIGLLAEPTMI